MEGRERKCRRNLKRLISIDGERERKYRRRSEEIDINRRGDRESAGGDPKT